MTNKLWADKFKKSYDNYSIGIKNITKWKLMNLLILKYEFPMKARGLSAFEIALIIINNKKLFNKLSEDDKDFVTGMLK
ncbi:MAG: hypothetical protein ACTSQE_17105 [Candidatus Heimdallarchaeaceae archaeon]